MVESFDDNEHSETYDLQMVNEYLKHNPAPSLESMEAFRPEPFMFDWRDFLMRDWGYKLEIFRKAGVVYIDGFGKGTVKDIYAEHVGEPIELEPVIVSSMARNEVDAVNVRFRCRNCKAELVFPNELSVEERKRKMDCGCEQPRLSEVEDKRDLIDVQWIKLEEIKRNRGLSRVPLSISAMMKGKGMMWSVQLNERIRPLGMVHYRTIKQDKGSMARKTKIYWFEIFGFKRVKRDEWDISLSEEDIERIKTEMQQPLFFDKLLKSFAPHIAGMEILKECALLTLASVKLSRPIRILIIGDPSMGKSEIEQYAANILPDSFYVVMSDARKTGLTTTSQKDPDTGLWMVEPGVFASAHQSAIWLDELQQGKGEDITALNNIIESGKIHYALAGGNYGEFEASCALMISCNAHTGMIGSEQNIHEILKFIGRGLAAFISRFDLIIVLKDEKTEELERSVASAVYRNSYSMQPIERFFSDWQTLEGEQRFGTESIRKIIKYVIEHVKIEPMPEQFEQRFIEYYMKNRTDVVERVNKVVNIRYMRHAITVAQVFARLQGRSQPFESDLDHVFDLLERHLSFAAFDPKTQEIDAGMLNGMQSRREQRTMDDQSEVRAAIDKYMNEKDPDGIRIHKFFTVEIMCEKLWYSDPIKWNDAEPKIRKIIDGFLKHRLIYEKGAEHSGEYDTSW